MGETQWVGQDMPRSHSRWPDCPLQGSLLPLAKSPRPLTPECYPNPCPSRPWGPPELSVPSSQPAQPPRELNQLSRSYLPPPGRGANRGGRGVDTCCLKDPSKSRQSSKPTATGPLSSPAQWKEVGKEVILEANDMCEHRRGECPRHGLFALEGKRAGPVASKASPGPDCLNALPHSQPPVGKRAE